MAVLGRVLLNSAERIDLPDLLSIDSYGAGDWKYFMQSLVGASKPYVLFGFDVINPGSAIGLPSCSIRVADSIVYYPGAAAGPFFYGLPEGNDASVPLVPQLRTNATNYVYLTLSTFNTASDTRALWDPDRNGGVGGEFTQDINTESVIQAQLGISTGSFPVNTVPLAIITVGASAISSITDARDMLFRLGTGGVAPNAQAEYAFPALPDSTHARLETSGIINSLANPNPFQGGDKNITTLKQWMDAIMTKLKELGGTTYWYEDTTTFSLLKIWNDALATAWKSKGTYTHSSSVPGQLSWSEDLYVKSMSSPVDIVIRASNSAPGAPGTPNNLPLSLANEQVAFLALQRDLPINALDEAVMFKKNATYINSASGATGVFGLLKKGDWVKKATDKNTLYLQVREFLDTAQTSNTRFGATVSAASARAVILSDPYQGTDSSSAGDRARFERGEYRAGDIQIVARSSNLLNDYAGDMMWFAQRSDTVLPIASISAVTLTGTVDSANGTNAIVTTSTSHGLEDGDRIIIATGAYASANPYYVDKIDNDTFTFKTASLATGALTGYYGLCTTTSNIVDGFQFESANHGFDSGDTILISGATNYNSSSLGYVVNVRDPTHFQFPIGATYAPVTTGLATLARLDVRSEEGIQKIVMGETINIGSGTIDDMQAFIGMTSLDQTSPPYNLPPSYGTLDGGANYNGELTDSLTARVAKNTAMLMDKAQDKTIKYATNAVEAIWSGGELSFAPPDTLTTSTLIIVQPGGVGNATVTLPTIGSPLAIEVNQSLYTVIDRNALSAPLITRRNTSAVPINENTFVLASRLSGTEVYLWDGTRVDGNSTAPLTSIDVPLVQCDLFDPVSLALPDVTIPTTVYCDNVEVQAGQLIVFGNLTADKNRVYRALGVVTTISGWAAEYKFHGQLDPVNGDTLLVKSGQGFALQVGKFNGTNWAFNDYVRYFNGADYWEQSNLVSATIIDNTDTDVFTTTSAGSEHILVDYSIVRSTARETGTMRIVTNGTIASVSTDSAYINGSSGVTFTAVIDGLNLILRATATSMSSTNATIKYSTRRWSDGAGGPAGVPLYSGAAPVPTPAAGLTNEIQFNGGSGILDGNSNFTIDIADSSMSFNGLRQGVLSSDLTILNNQAAFTNLLLLTTPSPFYVLEYSIVKEGFKRIGHLKIAYDGTNVACNDSYVETGATGVVLQAIVSGGIQIQYTSTAGAGAGTFKYAWRKWS